MKKYFLFLFLSFDAYSAPFSACDDSGMAGIYPCQSIDLMSQVPLTDMGGTENTSGNDIWGWTDPETNKEYALMGMSNGTAFVDVSDPKNPIYLGHLPVIKDSSKPFSSGNSIWRDIKTYSNHAYIVSESSAYGMQVFDLTQLRDLTEIPQTFTHSYHYSEFGRAHNIVINESSGFAYAVGTSTCGGGLHMIDLQDPVLPISAGCFSSGRRTHDAQCVTYIGPDTEHQNQEICFDADGGAIIIVDVTDKNAPNQISEMNYEGRGFAHQSWLTDDHHYMLSNDELDEENFGHNTRTYIWDLSDLELPVLMGYYEGPNKSIDHNIYIKGKLAYLTNYSSGLRIVDISDIGNANLQEIASFDSFPSQDFATFDGAWSSYPYFESGNIILSDYDSGLFILSPNICPKEASNNTEVPVYCEQQEEPKTIQPGLWYDPTHNGHGFAIEPIANSDLYFTIFYTYKDDGSPEWYTSLSTLEDGNLNINMDSDTLQRFTYDFSIDPTGATSPNTLDTSQGTNIFSINFNPSNLTTDNACQSQLDQKPNSALASWQLGDKQGSWCVVPLIEEQSYPTPDLGATWWTGPDDDGWGLTLAFSGETIVVVVYFYDADGFPRWVLGQASGFNTSEDITVDLQQFQGYGRNDDAQTVSSALAGTITLNLNSTTFDLNQDGTMSIDIKYTGVEGNNWQRNNVPITNISKPH